MMSDIFSAFDPASFNSIIPSPLFIIINLTIILLIQLPFWSSSYRMSTTMFMMKTIMMSQLNRTFSSHIKGMNNNISSLFIMIILINLLGLAPYQFSLSSHLIITLSLGLPLWLSMILSSVTKFPKMFIAHLLPDGAQDWLNPFLVLIESTSITVRPLTLSFRLAANMSAGHIVLGLLGIYTTTALFSSLSTSLILLPTAVGYILFEVAICLMQAYIFCLLLSLYSDEHAH